VSAPTESTTNPPFDEGDLAQIVSHIRRQPCHCVPFLGAAVNVRDAGRSYPGMLLGRDLAGEFLKTPDFTFVGPVSDRENLAKVTLQYEIRNSRGDLVNRLKTLIPDDDHSPSPLLRTLARMPFKLIVSTNYDRLMERALMMEGKQPGRDFLRIVQPPAGWDIRANPQLTEKFLEWAEFEGLILYKIHGSFLGSATSATPPAAGAHYSDNPLIITEEDYIQFMTAMGHDDHERVGIPQCIRSRMTERMLLFLGYGLEDWDIRALYKGLIDSLDNFKKRDSFAIQKNANSLWQRFWNKRDVLVRNFDLYQFAEELHQAYFKEALNWSHEAPSVPWLEDVE
jgi:hypothetical protein